MLMMRVAISRTSCSVSDDEGVSGGDDDEGVMVMIRVMMMVVCWRVCE